MFEEKHIRTSTSIKEAAQSDIVFLSLPNSEIVASTVCGQDGLLNYMHDGQIIVDLSTISYKTTLEIALACSQKSVGFLDAPVSGMKARADDGTLTIMCGGPETAFEQVKPYLAFMGTKIIYMGQNGSGQLAKLINQLLFDINAAALAEVLPMSVKMGLDSQKIGEIINNGTGRSYASEFFIKRDLQRIFNEGYAMEKAYKDLVSATEICAQEGIPMPVLNAATVTYQTALLRGLGEESKGAMIKVYEDLLGVEFCS